MQAAMASNADPTPPVSSVLEEWTASLQELIIPSSSLEGTSEKLGSGSYTQTSVVKLSGVKCVSKTVHASVFAKDGFRTLFIDGCRKLGKLRHPNLVQFLGVQLSDAGTPPSLIFELLPLNLQSCLQKYPQFPKHEKYTLLLDVARGLQHLHNKVSPVVHGRICAKNVLLTSALQAKITDSIRFETQGMVTPNLPYQPPEGMESTSGDIFCFGDLILEVLLQKLPSPLEDKHHHEDPGETTNLSEVQRRKRFFDSIGDGLDSIKDVAVKCLDDDSSVRPSSAALVEDLDKIVVASHPEFHNMLDMTMALGQLTLSKETIDSLNRTVQSKEVEIEALKQQIEPMQKELDAKDEVLDAQKQEVNAYKQALQSKEARIRAHESGNRAKEALIKAKDREIAAKKLDVAAKESLIRASHKRIQVLEQQVSAVKRGDGYPLSPASITSETKLPSTSSVASSDGLCPPPKITRDDSSDVVLRKNKGRKGRAVVSDGFAYQNSSFQRSKSMNADEFDPALANILARQHQRIEEAENLEAIQEQKTQPSQNGGKSKSSSPPPVRPKRARANSGVREPSPELQKILEKPKSPVED